MNNYPDLNKSFTKLKNQIMEKKIFNPRNYTISKIPNHDIICLERDGFPLFVIPHDYVEEMVSILAAAQAGAELFPKSFKNKKTKSI